VTTCYILFCATKAKVQWTKAFLRVLKYSNGGVLEVINVLHWRFWHISIRVIFVQKATLMILREKVVQDGDFMQQG